MNQGLRAGIWGLGLLALAAVAPTGCTHKEDATLDKSEVSVTDEVRTVPESQSTVRAPAEAPHADKKIKDAVRTTKANADRKEKAAEGKGGAALPREGSEEEYAADVDAAMGDMTGASLPTPAPSNEAASGASARSEADNSRVNRLSDGDKGLSADQQGNSKEDIEITRKIRRTITNNKDLSVYAHNVKIITRDGRVVLKGPVRSEAERKMIEDTAVTVAGLANVTSGIEITAK